jgi:hypothetical protein
LKVSVQRGQEVTSKGVLLYEITLTVSGSKYAHPILYTTFQRYSRFKSMNKALMDLNKQQEEIRVSRRKSAANVQSYHRESFINRPVHTDPAAVVSVRDEFSDESIGRSGGMHDNFMDLLMNVFPSGIKTYLGMSLTDLDLSQRFR